MDPLTPPSVAVFRRRWYCVMLATLLLGVAFAAIRGPGSPPFGLSPGQWFLLGLGLLAVWGLVYWLNWRCPACGLSPSQHWRPLYCGECGAPLLESSAHRTSLAEWRRKEMDWNRQVELAWVGRRSVGLAVVAIGVFFFGIVLGVGGRSEGRWFALGMAAFLLALGGLLARWIREGFEAAELPPERAEGAMWGMLGVAGMIMVFLGFGGFIYLLSPFDPTPTSWELRLAPVPRAEALAVAFGAYTLVGILLLAKGLRALRNR